jgi:hypothetical protein
MCKTEIQFASLPPTGVTEHHLDRVAEGTDERMNLGGQSAAGSADGLRTVFYGMTSFRRRRLAGV